MWAAYVILNFPVPTFKKEKQAGKIRFNNTFYFIWYIQIVIISTSNQYKHDLCTFYVPFCTKSGIYFTSSAHLNLD